MTFTKLTATVKETGETFVLYDGEKFQNFDRLKELVGRGFTNLNDDLMDGVCESNDFSLTREYVKYKFGDAVLHILFTYEV